MSVFQGSGVALITPFDSTGVNTAEFSRFIEFQIANGTDALIVCGTTGEPATMTEAEKEAAITTAVNTAKGRVPVIVGTGCNSTAKSILDSQRACELGADALLVVTPYYNKCTQSGLAAHFTAIADAVDKPIIMYNVPSRTGVNLLPATAKQLAAHKNIAGVKEASGNIEQISELMRLCPELDVYSGDDGIVLPVLALGGKGVISVVADCAPQLMHKLVQSFFDGDIDLCRKLQFAVNPLVKALFAEVNPIPVNTAVSLIGFETGGVRLPLTELTEANKEVLKARMCELELI